MSAYLNALAEEATREDLLAQIARLTEERARTAASHSARVTELLEANNGEVERRRDAESALKALQAATLWTLADLQAANIVRDAEWRPKDKPPLDLSFRGNELAGEVGEACNFIKKLERERLGWPGSRATKEQLAEELADTVICASLAAMTADIDLMRAVAAKFNATSQKMGLATRLPGEPSQKMAPSGELLPIFAVDGLGARLSGAMEDYLKHYVFGLDDGSDHMPTEFERLMLEDFLAGAISDEAVNDILQQAARAIPVPAGDKKTAKVAWKPTHRHFKRGSLYRVIGEAEAQVSKPTVNVFSVSACRPMKDEDRLTVYQGADGKLWARFSDEFNDGRFVAIEAEA